MSIEFVVKRDGNLQEISFDKITNRIKKLSNNLNVDPVIIAQKTIASIYNEISTSELDKISANICGNMISTHPDYNKLGGRILISNLHKSIDFNYKNVVHKLYNRYTKENFTNSNTLEIKQIEEHNPLISREIYDFVNEYGDDINKIINYDNDYNIDFFAFQTLERAYLIKIDGKIIESPQHMLMRVAIAHYKDLDKIKEMYNDMSNKYYTPATPTLYNAGTNRQQLSSCFVLGTNDDIDGIFKTISDSAKISKYAGGIGIAISDIRAKGSLIRGTNGSSNGIIPMVKVYNELARYIDQGGNKRKGAISLYLEPWHPDIYDFINLKKNTGSETERARDIFLGLWICDLFMKRVENNQKWSLMCPDICKGLTTSYGVEFEKKYLFYEENNMFVKQINARDLFNAILSSQFETGVPYILYKDNINNKSNHQNIGVIKGSNLCAEICIYFDENEYAVCTLSSISLPKFIENGNFNYNKLVEISEKVCENLNRVIDINYYPTPESKKSSMKHRPIGIGVQGLADVFALMKIPFDSIQAKEVNKKIFEAIYYGALKKSNELAKIEGPYELFEGSPFSKGILQFDMWNIKPSTDWNWTELKNDIIKYGTRNSLLTALMPTASTSQIMGNNEAFEPFTSNLYSRQTLAGNFTIINKYLISDLIDLKLWNDEMKQTIIYYKGSIQNIKKIPQNIRDLYKTSAEIKQKVIVDMAIDRGPYIDQTQSMNLFFDKVNTNQLTSSHFYGWKNGLKTGIYYLRTKPVVDAKQYSINNKLVNKIKQEEKEDTECSVCSA